MTNPIPTLPDLQNAWAAQFPGTSLLITLLRTALALADWHARQIQANFLQLHRELHQTGLPMHLWDPLTHRTFVFLQLHNTRAQREFRLALRLFQASYKEPAPQPQPVPAPEPDPVLGTALQTIRFTRENGHLITHADPPASFFTSLDDNWKLFSSVTRQFTFSSDYFPEPYTSLLTHKGVTHTPKINLLVSYTPNEFLRLCQLEIETGCPHLLDSDNRRDYYWHGDFNHLEQKS